MVVAVGEIRACVLVQHGVKKGESTCALMGAHAVPLSQEGRGLTAPQPRPSFCFWRFSVKVFLDELVPEVGLEHYTAKSLWHVFSVIPLLNLYCRHSCLLTKDKLMDLVHFVVF